MAVVSSLMVPNFNVIWAKLSIWLSDKYILLVTWVNVIFCFENFSH